MKNLLRILSFSMIVFLVVLNSCKKKSTKTTTYSATCNSTKSYSVDVKPLIQSSCVSCHSGYSSYTTVKNSASSIKNTIIDGSMPKGSSLSDAQKDNIICWIDAGATNN